MKSFIITHKLLAGKIMAISMAAMIPWLISTWREPLAPSESDLPAATAKSMASMMMCTDARPITRWNRLTDAQVSALNDNDPLTNVTGFNTGFCNGMAPITVDIAVTGAPNSGNPATINQRFTNRWGLTSFNNSREAGGNSGNKFCFTFSEPLAFSVNSNEHRFFHDSEHIKVTAFDNANVPMTLTGSLNGPVGPATTSGSGTTEVSFDGNLKRGTGVWWDVTSNGSAARQVCVEYYKTGPGQGFYGREPFTLNICDRTRCLFDDPVAAADPANPTPMAPIADRLALTKSTICTVPASSGVPGNVDATFRMVMTNNGNSNLTSLQIEDDLGDHIPAAAFIQIVGVQFGPGTTATTSPTFNAVFSGIGSIRIFSGSDGLLMPGQSVVVDMTLELNPNQLTAYESITNQSFGFGTDATLMYVSAASDAPTDQPGDTGGVMDGLLLRIPAINIAKYVASYETDPACNSAGQVECTLRFLMENTGDVRLDSLHLIENLSSQLGGAFVSIVSGPTITASTALANPTINATYTGVAPNNNIFSGNAGRLAPGQTIEVSLVLRLDPNSPTATNPLQNQAFVFGRGIDESNVPYLGCTNGELHAIDNSDSGTVPESYNATAIGATLNSHEDPLPLSLPNIGAAKSIVSFAPANSQTPGNLDVRFRILVKNTGNVNLTNLQLSDDLPSQLGAAYVGIVSPPAIVASTAAINPALGSFPNSIFNGATGQLNPNQTITVEFVVEMNPDAPGLVYPLENQAIATATGIGPNGVALQVTSLSDGGTDPESVNAGASGDTGCSDDELAIQTPAIRVAKHFAGIDYATSGTPGNFDVITEIVVQNVGNVDLTNLSLLENLGAMTNLGPAFVSVTQAPQIVAVGVHGTVTNALASPTPNAAFSGSGDLLTSSGTLKPGQLFVLQFRFEVNPDAPGTPAVLKNQVQAFGTGIGPANAPMLVSDLSDDGHVPQSNNPGYLGNSGGTNDPTLLSNCWNLLGTLTCNDNVQVSLNQVCEIWLTPDMVLEGEYSMCSNANLLPLGTYYEVFMVMDAWGALVPDLNPATPNVYEISGSYIGQTLTVKIRDRVYQNTCWGEIFIQDKLPPAFNCPSTPVQVFCSANLANVPPPTVTDNCDPNPLVTLVSQQIIDNDICDGTYVVRRTYKATDNQGNVTMANCVQTINVVRPAVDFPDDITWTCTQYDTHPTIVNPTTLHPSITDTNPIEPGIDVSPSLGANILAATGSGVVNVSTSTICGYNVLHTDQVIATCGESFKILRTWMVVDWCTGTIVNIGVGGEDNVQVIKVMDSVAPIITRTPFTVSANVPAIHPNPCRSTGLLLPPIVSDNCNTVTVQINTPVGPAIMNAMNGGTIPAPGLGLGTHLITYIATDACGNITSINVPVTVVDDITPTAVCNGVLEVDLPSTPNGFATVLANVFDNGSNDNCCLHHFEVRRMTDACNDGHNDIVFGPSVVFCCEDIPSSPIMVVMRAFDCNGNFNDCMVEVEVNDKLAPTLLNCPLPQRMTCDVFAANYQAQLAALGNNQTAKSQLFDAAFGQPSFADNCSSMTVNRTFASNLTQCLEGTITRTWVATDAAGQASGTCSQQISVDHVSDFGVSFPADITVNCGQALPDFGEPTIFNESCEMIAVTHTDSPFEVVPDACYKVVRTWQVINWCVQGVAIDQEVVEVPESLLGLPFPQCDLDGDGDCDSRTFRDSWTATQRPTAANATTQFGPDTDPDSDPWDGVITYTQVVKVIDNVAPVFTGCLLPNICINDSLVCSATFTLPQPTVLDCSPQATITASTTGGLGLGLGPFTAGPGTYTTTFTATDSCNNVSVCTSTFTVRDCKAPTPRCLTGLIVGLTNTLPPSVTVNAIAMNNGSSDNCPGALNFSFSPNIANTTRAFNCGEVGVNPVQIWVTDVAGNQAFCSTEITIQDNTDICDDDTLVVNLGGFILNEDDLPIGNVSVSMSGQSNATSMSGANGSFHFSNLPIGQDVTILPSKDDNPLAGITTFDLVLMSKHILNIQHLDSPYKIIAADVNNSKNVTTFDLVELRKLILHIEPDFANNTSWRFVERAYDFPVPMNPWAEDFPEVVNINDIPAEVLDVDFVAVKIGDVNNSSGFAGNETDDRNNGSLVFEAKNQHLLAGETHEFEFKAPDFAATGYQFTLEFDSELLEFVEIGDGTASVSNFGFAKLNENALTASWNQHDEALEEKATFTVVFRAKANGNLDEAIWLSDRFTRSEAYDREGQVLNVRLQFAENEAIAGFELFQNRPNPFSKETVIGFRLPEAGPAQLTITDAAGKLVKTLEGQFQQGYNEVTLDRNSLGQGTGILYYRLASGTATATKMMLLTE